MKDVIEIPLSLPLQKGEVPKGGIIKFVEFVKLFEQERPCPVIQYLIRNGYVTLSSSAELPNKPS